MFLTHFLFIFILFFSLEPFSKISDGGCLKIDFFRVFVIFAGFTDTWQPAIDFFFFFFFFFLKKKLKI